MKNLITIILILFSINSFGQMKRDKFIEKNIGGVKLIYQRAVDIEKGDSTYVLFFSFQNAKYSRLTDIKIIGLFSRNAIEQWMKDMKSAYKQILTGEKVDMDWNREEYKLTLYNFSKNLILTEGKGTGGYTLLSKNNVRDLMELVSTVDFGKETLLPAKSVDELIK
jgi:hypothetical protein